MAHSLEGCCSIQLSYERTEELQNYVFLHTDARVQKKYLPSRLKLLIFAGLQRNIEKQRY